MCLQYPDPHWKTRYRKRRIVQPQLVQAIADMLSPDGQVFLQSDVQEVVLRHCCVQATQHGASCAL